MSQKQQKQSKKLKMSSLIQVLQKFQKYWCGFNRMFSGLIVHKMKTRQLINESNFQKITKPQTFIIRNKQSQNKLRTVFNTSKSVKALNLSQRPHKLIEDCILELQSSLQQKRPIDKEICRSIRRFLLQLKDKYFGDFDEQLSSRATEEDIFMSITQKNSVNNIIQKKKQFLEESQNKENLNECLTNELRRTKIGKIKRNNQINDFETSMPQLKLKRLTSKVSEYEEELSKNLKQIQQIQNKLNSQTQEKISLELSLKNLIINNNQKQIQLKYSLVEKEERVVELAKKNDQMRQCLEMREKQIITLWQLINQ